MLSNDSIDKDLCEGLYGIFLVIQYKVGILYKLVYYNEYRVVPIPYRFFDRSRQFSNEVYSDLILGFFWQVDRLNITVFSMSFYLVYLTFYALFDVCRNLLSHLWECEVSLDEFNGFSNSRMSLSRVFVMLSNIFLLLVQLNIKLPLHNRKFFICVVEDSQDIPKFFNVSAQASVRVEFENAILNCFLPIYIVASPTKCIGSAIIASQRVLYPELILSEEFSLSNLLSV